MGARVTDAATHQTFAESGRPGSRPALTATARPRRRVTGRATVTAAAFYSPSGGLRLSSRPAPLAMNRPLTFQPVVEKPSIVA